MSLPLYKRKMSKEFWDGDHVIQNLRPIEDQTNDSRVNDGKLVAKLFERKSSIIFLNL